MSKFVKVEPKDDRHLYEYINVDYIYAIKEEGGKCKVAMANTADTFILDETVEHFLERISHAD